MHVERLERLAKLMDRIEDDHARFEKFDLLSWFSGEVPGIAPEFKPELKCEYTACAVGNACIDPWFIQQGLGFEDPKSWGMSPVYDGYKDWEAVDMFFDIDRSMSEWLFLGTINYAEPGQVAQRIREVLAKEGNY